MLVSFNPVSFSAAVSPKNAAKPVGQLSKGNGQQVNVYWTGKGAAEVCVEKTADGARVTTTFGPKGDRTIHAFFLTQAQIDEVPVNSRGVRVTRAMLWRSLPKGAAGIAPKHAVLDFQ